MSNPIEDEVPQPTFSNYTLSVIGAISSMLLFLLIIFIAYVYNQPEPANADIVANRESNLADVRAKQAQLYNNYGWVDKNKGVVRIPVEQAMKLAVERLNK